MEIENTLTAEPRVEVQAQCRESEYLDATVLSFKIGMAVAGDFIERMKRLSLEERRSHPTVRVLERNVLRALHRVLWEEENRKGDLDDG